jgi:hypothetical protein
VNESLSGYDNIFDPADAPPERPVFVEESDYDYARDARNDKKAILMGIFILTIVLCLMLELAVF